MGAAGGGAFLGKEMGAAGGGAFLGKEMDDAAGLGALEVGEGRVDEGA